MIRAGSGPAVVLLHGVLNSERIWDDVIPLLAKTHEVFAFTAMGHRGGRAAQPGATLNDLVDDMERQLDGAALHRPHLVGSSMGGAMALALAKRGRAAAVCALSPAGFWDVSDNGHEYCFRKLRQAILATEKNRWLLWLFSFSASFRHKVMAMVARHGEKLTARQFVTFSEDTLGCDVGKEWFLEGMAQIPEVEAMDVLPCPITIAWSEQDRLFPVEINGERARKIIPGAEWKVLSGVGHLPMIDDPALVAETIRAAIKRAE